MRRLLLCCALFCLPLVSIAADKVLNIYAWSGEIPDSIVRRFEKETGIKVNLSTYANNEVMYAKLRATQHPGYDIVEPSSYYVDRMRRQNMLDKLDKNKLPNFKNLNPAFLHADYDPLSEYSVPHVVGVTGIFVNQNYYPDHHITRWSDLWDKHFYDQLMLLDDTREVFSMALLALHYSANDRDPEHIKAAFLKLKALMKNVKLFSSDTVTAIIIDEDANIGMAWNGDVYKASQENKAVHFIFPADGFVIWIDNFTIPKNAPHKDNAYRFINFLLRADIGRDIALATHFSTANLAAQKLLPPQIRDNPMIYPSEDILRHGQFQTDVGDEALALYEKYWEELKLSS